MNTESVRIRESRWVATHPASEIKPGDLVMLNMGLGHVKSVSCESAGIVTITYRVQGSDYNDAIVIQSVPGTLQVAFTSPWPIGTYPGLISSPWPM